MILFRIRVGLPGSLIQRHMRILENCFELLIRPFLFCIRQQDLSRREARQTFFKISNGRKVPRMAPISMIFGPIESHQCQLNFEEFPRCRKKIRADENVEKLSRKVRKSLPGLRFPHENKIEIAIFQKTQKIWNDFFGKLQWRS